MNISRTHDSELIKSIVFHPELLKTTNYSQIDTSHVEIDTNKECYLVCKIDGVSAGVCAFEMENTNSVSYHPNLLPKYRGKHSTEFTIKALKWLYENAPKIIKVNVKIPSNMKSLIKHAKSIGFKFEGVDRCSIIINEKVLDQTCMGITRIEIGGLNVNN